MSFGDTFHSFPGGDGIPHLNVKAPAEVLHDVFSGLAKIIRKDKRVVHLTLKQVRNIAMMLSLPPLIQLTNGTLAHLAAALPLPDLIHALFVAGVLSVILFCKRSS